MLHRVFHQPDSASWQSSILSDVDSVDACLRPISPPSSLFEDMLLDPTWLCDVKAMPFSPLETNTCAGGAAMNSGPLEATMDVNVTDACFLGASFEVSMNASLGLGAPLEYMSAGAGARDASLDDADPVDDLVGGGVVDGIVDALLLPNSGGPHHPRGVVDAPSYHQVAGSATPKSTRKRRLAQKPKSDSTNSKATGSCAQPPFGRRLMERRSSAPTPFASLEHVATPVPATRTAQTGKLPRRQSDKVPCGKQVPTTIPIKTHFACTYPGCKEQLSLAELHSHIATHRNATIR